MSAKPERVFELMQEISKQNEQILSGINELLSETKEVRKINDDQLKELKRGRPE